jgi:M6 family metalloprotease-like protein
MAAEWGGTDCFGTFYTNRVWSHKWAFYDEDFRVDGVRVYNYNISPGQWGRTCTAAQSGASASDGCTAAETLPIGHIGVIAHELGHYIGLPDMYDGAGGQGIGSYDLMANSWGHDGTQNNPPPFSVATKMSLGWIVPTPVTPTAAGTVLTVVHGKSRLYQVSPPSAADTNEEHNVYANSYYKISAGFQDPANEYFLLEVSRNYGHHDAQPCQGLLLWHVDTGKGYLGSGLDNGETCFPYNLVHYTTALVQADGLYHLERGLNRYVRWHLWCGSFRRLLFFLAIACACMQGRFRRLLQRAASVGRRYRAP